MEKRRPPPRRVRPAALAVLLALALSAAGEPVRSEEGSVKDSFKKMGKAIGQAGKEVGKSAAQAGREIGRESQKVWYRGVEVSKPALEKAQAETRRALKKSLDAMDRSIAAMKRELQRLEAEEAAQSGDE